MGLSKGWDRHFFINNVMESGRSLNVTKGQFAVVNNSAAPSKDGRLVTSDFDGLSKNTELVILQGIAKSGEPRTSSNKPWSTMPFSISEIEGLRVEAPTVDFQVDEFVIGYNGFDEDTAITFENGQNESLNITLSGEPLGMLGYVDSKATFTLEMGAPNEGEFTNHEIVQEAVERLRRMQFMGGIPITKYVDIGVINSENPDAGDIEGEARQFFHLNVEDTGDSLGFASVQAQYPDHKVVKTDRSGGVSTYTIVAPTDTELEDFTKFRRGRIKGCESCPEGYSEAEGGVVYSVSIADGGEDSSAAVTGISTNVVADSTVKIATNENGVSIYSVVVSEDITQEEVTAFVEANASATVERSGEVQEVCSPDNQETVTWTDGDECTASTETYTTVVGDDKCGEPRTAEIQAHYPDLEITEVASAQCATKYSTTVITNVVCEECDPAYRDLFVSEAPEDFKEFSWKKDAAEYSETALMGIRLKGKKMELSGSEVYRDYLPFIATSVRLSVAGGYYNSQMASFNEGSGDRFHVEIRSRATEPALLGGNLQELEESSRRYFEDESRQYQNGYGTWIKGEESILDPTTPYVDFVLTIRRKTLTQGLSGEKNETMHYHFITEVGVHQQVEDILNKVVAKAGVAPVQAFGKASE